MARPNYSSQKRQTELAKQKKRDEKLKKRHKQKDESTPEHDGPGAKPGDDGSGKG